MDISVSIFVYDVIIVDLSRRKIPLLHKILLRTASSLMCCAQVQVICSVLFRESLKGLQC